MEGRTAHLTSRAFPKSSTCNADNTGLLLVLWDEPVKESVRNRCQQTTRVWRYVWTRPSLRARSQKGKVLMVQFLTARARSFSGRTVADLAFLAVFRLTERAGVLLLLSVLLFLLMQSVMEIFRRGAVNGSHQRRSSPFPRHWYINLSGDLPSVNIRRGARAPLIFETCMG